LRKRWNISDMDDPAYKALNMPKDFNHENAYEFEEKNDFLVHKSDLIESDEDDLDDLDFEIQYEIVEKAERFMREYDQKKNKHKREKNRKKSAVD
jgi:hypothetical protein